MMLEIKCIRSDCEFWLDGHCSYGGEAVNISAAGCDTYEPAEQEEN